MVAVEQRAGIPSGPSRIESPLVRSVRALSAEYGGILFPANIEDHMGGLAKSEWLLQQGNGLVIVQNHFSLRDPIESIHFVLLSEVMRERKILCPVAYHEAPSALLKGASLYDIEVAKIVTEHTVELKKNNELAKGTGAREYADRAVLVLRNGGIVILCPQATRQERLLDTPDTKAVSGLVAFLRRNRVTNVAFLFLGIGIKGEQNYSKEKVGGMNFGRRYTVNVSRVVTMDEMMQEAGLMNRVDHWAYEKLRQVVPQAYR